jgi:predicted RNA binding protein with dsRBD fold (UPF0201 family)
MLTKTHLPANSFPSEHKRHVLKAIVNVVFNERIVPDDDDMHLYAGKCSGTVLWEAVRMWLLLASVLLLLRTQ